MSWLRGIVKEVSSGDTVVVVAGGANPGVVPAEKRITLSSLVAPKLVRVFGGSGTFHPRTPSLSRDDH
jgi:hypothetical protein